MELAMNAQPKYTTKSADCGKIDHSETPQQLALPDPDLQSRLDAQFARARERFRAPKPNPERVAQLHLDLCREVIAVALDERREALLHDVRERFGPDAAKDGAA